MASKLFPALPRAGRQFTRQFPKPQSRLFSAGPQLRSETLAVVRDSPSIALEDRGDAYWKKEDGL